MPLSQSASSEPSILFAGDVHGRFAHLLAVALAQRPKALVLLGDIESEIPLQKVMAPIEALGTEVWFIPGNHDTDNPRCWAALQSWPERNLHARVVEIAGVRVAGLGGIFREEIWHPNSPIGAHFDALPAYLDHQRQLGSATDMQRASLEARMLKHHSSLFPSDLETLASEEADVLVTHEAPSCHPNGFSVIDDLARALRVRHVFHGHHHDCLDYNGSAEALGFQAHGVGLRGITALDGSVLRNGELDVVRARSRKPIIPSDE